MSKARSAKPTRKQRRAERKARRKNRPKKYHFLFLAVLAGIIPFAANYSLFALELKTFKEEHVVLSVIWLTLYPLGVLGAIFRRRLWLLLLGLAPGHVVAAGLIVTLTNSEGVDFETSLVAAVKIAFAYFLIAGRIRSIEFAAALGLTIGFAGLHEAGLFLLSSLGLRFAVMVIGQNISIFREVGFFRTAALGFKTFLFWWPILLFAVPLTLATHIAHDRAIDAMYEAGLVGDPTATGENPRENRDFLEDLLAAADKPYVSAEARVHSELESIRARIHADVGSLPNEINTVYLDTIKPAGQIPGLAPSASTCSWYDVPCHILHEIKEGIKSSIRGGYNRTREKYRRRLYNKTQQYALNTEMSADAKIDAAKQDMSDLIAEARESTRNSILRVYFTIRFLQMLSDITFAYLCIQSYLYVFARVAFAMGKKKHNVLVTLRTTKHRAPCGEIRKRGRQFGISGSGTESFYVARKFEPVGRAPKYSVPQPLTALPRRIQSRTVAMNKIDFGPGLGPVHFTAVKGAEFIECRLAPGEVLIFDFRNFVGMSERVRLSSLISFRVTSVLFGRLLFTTARGPGTLVLMSKGNPTVSGERKAAASTPPNRLLAWDKNARFAVDSELNLIDVYMSGVYLKQVGGEPVVIDADLAGKPGGGLGKFVRYFLLPV